MPSTGLTQFGHGSWLGGGAAGLESQSICGTGGLFRAGYDATLDELRDSVSKAKRSKATGSGSETATERRTRRNHYVCVGVGGRAVDRGAAGAGAAAHRHTESQGPVRSGLRGSAAGCRRKRLFSLSCSATQTIATCGVAHVPFSLRHATCACSSVHSVFCLDALLLHDHSACWHCL